MTDIIANLDAIVAIAGYKVARNDGKNVEALVNEIKEQLLQTTQLYYDPIRVIDEGKVIDVDAINAELDEAADLSLAETTEFNVASQEIGKLIDDIAADGGISTDEVDQLKEAIDASTEETSSQEASGDQV